MRALIIDTMEALRRPGSQRETAPPPQPMPKDMFERNLVIPPITLNLFSNINNGESTNDGWFLTAIEYEDPTNLKGYPWSSFETNPDSAARAWFGI